MSVDVHSAHPSGCPSCALGPAGFACLEHTCPDCGSIVWNERNERGELSHRCPEPSVERVAFSLMVEEPGLPIGAALAAAAVEQPRVRLVSSAELLRLAALGYRVEQL